MNTLRRPERPSLHDLVLRILLPGLTALAALLALAPLTANPLRAQDPVTGDTTNAEARADTAIPLSPITVRVLRWPLAVQDVPVAVSTVGAEREAPSVRLGLGQLLVGVPGLQAENRYNPAQGDRIVIRGFGARAQFGVRGVMVRVDGIPATMPDGQSTLNHLDLTELARAEVVRGPASVLYGNAAGGAVLLETVAPPSRGRSGEVAVTTGAGGLLRVRASAGLATRQGDGRVALTREQLDGFRAHAGSESWNLTGSARATVAGGQLRVATHLVRYDARNPGSLTAEQFRTDPDQAQERNVLQGTGEKGTHAQLGGSWTRTLDAVELDASSWVLRRSLDNPIPPAIIHLDRYAAGGRLLARSRPAARLRWAAGVEVSGQWDDRLNFANDRGRRGERVVDQAETVENAAAFGQLLLPVTRNARLFAAARWDRVRFEADDRLVGSGNPDDSGSRTLSALSPALGLTLDATPWLSLFGNVSTSFQTPTTTELVNRPDGAGGFNPDLEPQHTVGGEVGARASRRIGRVRVEAELVGYRAEVTDALVPFEVPAAPGRSFFRNAGSSLHTGVEAALSARRPGTEAGVTLTVTRTEFLDYRVEEVVYDGRAVPGVRPWVLEAWFGQDLPRGFRLTMDGHATGHMHADDANTVSVDGYQRVSLSVAAPGLVLGPVRLSPYGGVENLLDQRYTASIVVNAFGGRYFEPAPGRLLFLGLRSTL